MIEFKKVFPKKQVELNKLKKSIIKYGDEIERGDLLAYEGDSGRSIGPHLHYEIQINYKPVNPLRYIK